MKLSKRRKADLQIFEAGKIYKIEEAVGLLKKAKAVKFDSSVDIQMKLNADANVSDQVVRGTTALPHGTGRQIRVVVLTKDEAGNAAKAAGADAVGGEDLIQKIMGGWMEFDVVVASPSLMKDIAKLGKVLGPRGLMPSPKAGTVTENLAEAVKEIKKGRVEFKMDKQSNLHSSIGRMSFDNAKLVDNARAFVNSVVASKPKGVKGAFIARAHMSSTMGPGLHLDLSELVREGADDEQ
jgi:large subunit ribosomal protein L1